MDPIPWYRSPVYVSTWAQIISLIVVSLGLQKLVPIDAINGYVQAFFVIAGLIAGGIAERKRRKSLVQPLMASKASADAAIAVATASGTYRILNPAPPVDRPAPVAIDPLAPAPFAPSEKRPDGMIDCHPVVVVIAVLAALAMFGVAGCVAVREAQTVEQRAGALLGDFNIFQMAALHVGRDPEVPDEVRLRVVDAARDLKPAVDAGDVMLRRYRAIAVDLAAAGSPDQQKALTAQLRIAEQLLSAWTIDIAPRISSLRSTIEGIPK
jgi:hypothetical protein